MGLPDQTTLIRRKLVRGHGQNSELHHRLPSRLAAAKNAESANNIPTVTLFVKGIVLSTTDVAWGVVTLVATFGCEQRRTGD